MSRQYFAINFYDNCDWLVIEEIPMCNLTPNMPLSHTLFTYSKWMGGKINIFDLKMAVKSGL